MPANFGRHVWGWGQNRRRHPMRRMIALLTIAGLTLLPSARAQEPAPQQTPEVQTPVAEIAGVYRVQGTNPDGSSYEGVAEIRKNGDTYMIRWTGISMGIGFLRNGVLVASYFGDGFIGTVMYRVETGRLVGEWTIAEVGPNGNMYFSPEIYPEVLTKMEQPESPSPPRPAPPPRPTKPPPVKSAMAI